ncbi:MAG: SDR family NAD(P)-dependent oxidoreductase [Marinosulfonomonas sp.]|nr:SDR family NAD(P)-dependent oxidoreductase [Marinosulfonomonas sp.]
MNSGPVALVTGGTAGIGLSACEVLARDGWQVVACARRIEGAEALREKGIDLRQCDIADPASVTALIEGLG